MNCRLAYFAWGLSSALFSVAGERPIRAGYPLCRSFVTAEAAGEAGARDEMGPQLRRVHAIVLARGAHATQAAAIVDAIKLRFWLTYELVSGSLFRDVAAVLNPNEVLDSSTHAIVADIIRTSNGHWALPFTLTCVSNADPNPNPNPNPNPSFARPERDIDRFALAGPILQVLLRPTPEVVRRLSQIDLGYWKDTVTENQTLPGSPGTNTARVAVGDMDVADDIFHVSAGPDAPRAPAQGLGVPSSKEDYALQQIFQHLAEGLGMGAMGMNAAQHLSYELQRYYLREVPSPELQTPFWRLLVRFYRQYDIAYFVHDWESLSTFFQRYPE